MLPVTSINHPKGLDKRGAIQKEKGDIAHIGTLSSYKCEFHLCKDIMFSNTTRMAHIVTKSYAFY